MPSIISISLTNPISTRPRQTVNRLKRCKVGNISGLFILSSLAILSGITDANAENTASTAAIRTKQSVAQEALSNAPSPINTPATSSVTTSQDNAAIARGAYIARAADCAGCHGENYSGGEKFVLPMGIVVSTNITPSLTHGIGHYSLQQFSDAIRKGKAPDHQLYPAMPYPSYSRMSDPDLSDLYAFMQTVEAVDESPKDKTQMKFPFNMRILMKGYNLINIPKWTVSPNLTESQKRGQYLVDNLGHCGDCHTPRTATMGYDFSHYLAGAPIQGVQAPNITTDNDTGIGRWSKQDIVKFLKTGELQHQALAGGEMGKVVLYSLQHLSDADLMAMAEYLKTVPAVKSGATTAALNMAKLPQNQDPDITYNLLKQIDRLKAAQQTAKPGTGESLYLNNCASCHGINGHGQTEASYPALTGLSILRENTPKRLIQVIAYGSKAPLDTLPNMPGFVNKLSDEQIAQIANYVRTNIGGMSASELTISDVKKLAEQPNDVPFLIANAGWLAILGVIAGIGLLGLLLWLLLRRRV